MIPAFQEAVLFLILLAVAASQQAGTEAFTGSLTDTGCYATKANGGWGYCGPASCKDAYVTCTSSGGGPATVDGVTGTFTEMGGTQYSESNCMGFLERTTTADETNWDPKGKCDSSCTQQTTGVCSGTFLASVLVGSGVKYAYCNDKWLIISSSGEPSIFTPNLDDVPFPPANSASTARTGMSTLDTTRSDMLFYPLSVTDLSTSAGTNNIGVFDETSGKGAYSYLIDGSDTIGIPSDNGIAMGVNGQSIFPIYNNNAKFTPQKCEVDSCGNHVGQGGGQPHFHGDPFGDESNTYCLYGPSNYSSGSTGHPPLIGFSFDGHLIYGRYLSASAPGFAAPLLDDCGGHSHTATDTDEHGFDLQTYHYHTQVLDATCPSTGMCTEGEKYTASTTGPYKCWKADLSQSEGSSALLVATASSSYKTKDDMNYRCCSMTDYYVLNGVDIASSVDSSTTCSAPAAPDNGAYASDSACATAGSTLYSGNQCTPTCDSGYCSSGTTRCVKGTLTETATCEACGTATATTATVTTTTVTMTSTEHDMTVTFTMTILPWLKSWVHPSNTNFQTAVQRAVNSGLNSVGTTSITSIDVPSDFVKGTQTDYTTLTVYVSVAVGSEYYLDLVNTLDDAMISDFATAVESWLVTVNRAINVSSVSVEDVTDSSRRRLEATPDDTASAVTRRLPPSGPSEPSGPSGPLGPSGRPKGKNCLRNGGTRPTGTISSSNYTFQMSLRNITTSDFTSDVDLLTYVEESIAMAIGDDCDVTVQAYSAANYVGGTYLKFIDATLEASGDLTEATCAYLLNMQLNRTSSVSSLESNALFENGGIIVVDDTSTSTNGTDAGGRKCCQNCNRCPSKRLSDITGFSESSFVAQREYHAMSAERCKGGTVLMTVDDTYASGGQVRANLECRVMDGCVAYEHLPSQSKIRYYSSIPDAASGKMAMVRHPKCMVKSSALCGSSCDASLVEAETSLRGSIARCADSSLPIWTCDDGTMLKALSPLQNDRCCSDGSTPTEKCGESTESTTNIIASSSGGMTFPGSLTLIAFLAMLCA